MQPCYCRIDSWDHLYALYYSKLFSWSLFLPNDKSGKKFKGRMRLHAHLSGAALGDVSETN
jgi:hypothetical protein